MQMEGQLKGHHGHEYSTRPKNTIIVARPGSFDNPPSMEPPAASVARNHPGGEKTGTFALSLDAPSMVNPLLDPARARAGPCWCPSLQLSGSPLAFLDLTGERYMGTLYEGWKANLR